MAAWPPNKAKATFKMHYNNTNSFFLMPYNYLYANYWFAYMPSRVTYVTKRYLVAQTVAIKIPKAYALRNSLK